VQLKGRDLLEQVFDHLSIIEKDYFGVCYQAETNKMVGTIEQIARLCGLRIGRFLCAMSMVK